MWLDVNSVHSFTYGRDWRSSRRYVRHVLSAKRIVGAQCGKDCWGTEGGGRSLYDRNSTLQNNEISRLDVSGLSVANAVWVQRCFFTHASNGFVWAFGSNTPLRPPNTSYKVSHKRSGFPEKSNFASGLHSFSQTYTWQVHAVFGDRTGGRKIIEKRCAVITVQAYRSPCFVLSFDHWKYNILLDRGSCHRVFGSLRAWRSRVAVVGNRGKPCGFKLRGPTSPANRIVYLGYVDYRAQQRLHARSLTE
jgi:hypothetical protein